MKPCGAGRAEGPGKGETPMGGKPEPIGNVAGRPVWPIAGGSSGEETPPKPEVIETPGGDATIGGKSAEAWQAEARKWEQRAKSNKAALDAKAKEDDASKSELQAIRESLERAEARAKAAEATALRAKVAQAKGLTTEQAERLRGETREELEEDAEDLIAAFGIKRNDGGGGEGEGDGEKPGTRPPGSRPREELSGGGGGASEVVETDPRKLAAMIEGNT